MQIFVRFRAAGVAALIASALITVAATAESFSNVTTFAGDSSGKVLKEPYGVVVLPSGELLVADTKNNRIQRISTGGVITPFAGSGKSGAKDGAAAVAEFKDPMGLAYDRVRNIVFVADAGNDRIRKIAADGTVSTVTVSGLKRPADVAVDADGNLYVSDTGHDVIRKITPSGSMTIIAGISNDNPDGPEEADRADNKYADGPALQATFDAPAGLALTSGGVLYIVDTKNDAVRKLEGGVVSTVAGGKRSGFADGAALAARFDRPTGIAIDSAGNLLIADRRNERIRQVTLGANAAVSTIAGTGAKGLVNGAPATAQFNSPSGLAFAGALYVTDAKNDVVRKLHVATSGPTITSVIPALAAAAGTDVRVLGSGFVNGQTAVSFGTVAAAQVTFVSASEVVAKVPALSSARYDVKVTTPGGTATLAGAFTFDPDAPLITAAAAPAPNGAGWNNAAVRVTFTCADALSGIATCTAPVDVTADNAAHVVTGVAVDRAGNQQSVSVTVKLDRTAPVATATATPAANAAGWNKADVTVTFAGTDALSGVASITPPVTVATDGAQQITGRVVDVAGNATEASVTVRLDKTAPTVTTSIAPLPNAAGWNNTDARVTFNCADAVSGIATCSTPVDVTAEGTAELTGTAVDVAGNEKSVTAAVKIDKTAPAIEFVLPPLDITRYFGRSSSTRDIEIIGNIVDAGSGATSVTCNGRAAAIQNGAFRCTVTLQPGQTPVSVVAIDAAGNTHTVNRELTYIIDDTPPTITAVVPPPNAAGWLRNVPVISFACDDDVALAFCPGSNYPNDGANQQFSGTAVDAAGNEKSLTITVSIDSQPPSLSVTTPQDSKTNASTFTITGTASDLTSGVQSVRCGSVPATLSGDAFTCVVPLAAGLNAIRVHAVDVAGNEQSQEITVTRDSVAPEITITAPAEGSTFGEASVEVTGTATDDREVAAVTVNGVPAALDDDRFAATVTLNDGVNVIEVRATDTYGNVATRSVSVRRVVRGSLVITSPADLAVVRSNAVTVTGTFSGPVTAIDVNGFVATINGLTFTAADVPLVQGRTVLTAKATLTGGQILTTSLNVYRDSIPPRAIVEYPPAGETVFGSRTIVSGTVDDLVVGTINAGQVTLKVNGMPAEVVNRTFKASGVELVPGRNTLVIVAEDQGGNTTTVSHEVHSSQAAAARVVILSGDDQSASIGAVLPTPVRVRVVDGAGNPRPGVAATFAVTQNNGSLRSGDESGRRVVVTTDAAGEAEVRWTLGMRAGVANQRLEIGAPGAEPAHVFASGRTGTPELVVIDMGDNQFGVNGERLPRPLVIAVVDAGSNRLADVPVRFTVLGGGGSIDGQPSVEIRTDTDGRAWVTPTLGPDSGFDNHLIEASVAGVASTAVFRASSAPAGPVSETKISGVILDNSSIPIAGATVRIEGTSVALQSDAQGQFVIPNAPVGYVRLIIDGSTVQRPGTWPMLEFAMYTNAGQDNTIGMPIFLLPIDVTRGVQVSEQQGGRLTLPELPGFSLDIAPGSVTFPGGGRIGTISATLVHNDKMPMVPGFGQQPRFIVTIQPAGAHFDPPVALTMPNVDGFGPGEVTELYSFDHDLGQFVAIGTGSVSEDGTIVRSDPGVGIIKAGWHCGGSPAGTGTTSCVNVSLTIDDAASGGSAATSSAAARIATPGVVANATSISAEKTTLTDVCVVLRATGSPTTAGSNGFYTWTKTGGEWVGGGPPSCNNQPTCEAKIRSNDPANITVTVTYTASTASGTQSDSESANIKFIHAVFTLEELSFLNDIAVKKDAAGEDPVDVADPVWKYTNVSIDNGPVAYVGNSDGGSRKIKVKAKFRIAPAPTVPVKVIFEGKALPSGGISGGTLKKEKTINAGQTEITIDDFDVSFTLPNSTAFANPLTIEWTVRPKGACPDATPFEAGISSNQVFVTLKAPILGPAYTTLLQLATSGNATTDLEALNQTWAQFGTGSAPANVKGWSPVTPSNRQLKYYPEGFSFASVEQNNFAEFLKTGSGRCGMHQLLFIGALGMNGLSSVSVEVNVDQSGCTATGAGSQKCGHAFLVKNWSFGTESLAYLNQTEYRYMMKTTCNGTTAECLFELVPAPTPPNRYADLTNDTGAPGQNTITPSQKLFGDHAIVKTTIGGTTRYFDPSYGLEYSGPGEFATKAVDGYVIVMALTPTTSGTPGTPPSPDPRLKLARKRVSNASGTELGVKFTPP